MKTGKHSLDWVTQILSGSQWVTLDKFLIEDVENFLRERGEYLSISAQAQLKAWVERAKIHQEKRMPVIRHELKVVCWSLTAELYPQWERLGRPLWQWDWDEAEEEKCTR